MDTEYFRNRIKTFWGKLRKRILSKKFLLIFCLSSIMLLTLYVGSYRHFRNNAIELGKKMKGVKPKDIRNFHIPSGYYLDIVFGVGLGKPFKGVYIYPDFVTKQGKVESCKWLYYFYYPLIQLEVKIWRIKNFGWE